MPEGGAITGDSRAAPASAVLTDGMSDDSIDTGGTACHLPAMKVMIGGVESGRSGAHEPHAESAAGASLPTTQAAAVEDCKYCGCSPCRCGELCHQCRGLPKECQCGGISEPLWMICADCGAVGPYFCDPEDDPGAAKSNPLGAKEHLGMEIESMKVQELTQKADAGMKMAATMGAAMVAVATAGTAATAAVGNFALST